MQDIDRVRFATLAQHSHDQADACRRAAIDLDGAVREAWLRIAAGWTKLAQEAESKGPARPNY